MHNLSYAIISAIIAFTITVLFNSRPKLKTRIAGWFVIRKCRRIANRYAEVAGLARAKLLILGGTFSLLLCLAAHGQTNPPSVISGPAEQIINFLGTGTNWSIAAYGIAGKNPGAGIGAFVQMSDFMEAGLRLDGVIKDKKLELWMPSGNFQLQAPIKLFGKLTTVPFVVGGIATPLSGAGSANGSIVGIFGVGDAIRIGKNWDIVFDVERWTGAGFKGQQYRLGMLYRF